MHAIAPFAFPMDPNYDNRCSSFFRASPGACLPTPDEVRLRALEAAGGAVSFDATGMRQHQFHRPPVLRMPGVLVKYGREVTLAEAHCMLFLRDYLERAAVNADHADVSGAATRLCVPVPVPEVYGWRTDQRQTFIYMQHVEGATLHAYWPVLTKEQRAAIGDRVRAMVATLHSVPQSLVSRESFVGHVNGGPLLDWTIVHSATPHAGPFAGTAAFHDWLAFRYGAFPRPALLPDARARQAEAVARRVRLPDDAPIVLTHGNLRKENIMIKYDPAHPDAVGGHRITAVLDWAQAGWYPAYWEDCKAHWHHGLKSTSSWATEQLRLGTDVRDATPAMRELWLEMVLRRAM